MSARAVTLFATAGLLLSTGQPSAAMSDDRVRPGLAMMTPTGQCSFGFLVTGSDGRQYASTAGHCALSEDGQRQWKDGLGPPVFNDEGKRIGEFAYAVEDSGRSIDFGLVRLDRRVRGNPQLCGWGGPVRVLERAREGPTQLLQHGQGVGIGSVVPNRRALARSLPSEPYTLVAGPFVPGDSGSGVVTADGEAVGLVAELTAQGDTGDAGFGIVRIGPALVAASKVLRLRLVLRTAPLLPEPPPNQRC